jgi:L-methionine (R)-S-oxide reductase
MNAQPDISKLIQIYLFGGDLIRLLPLAARIETAAHDFINMLGELPHEFDENALYRYPVPMLSDDGACSLIDELAPTPYDLAPIIGGRSASNTRKLLLLHQLVGRATEVLGADWLGIYQRCRRADGTQVLAKLSYRGRPSRAEFSLDAEFARDSSNSSVGLSGKALVIDDIEAYRLGGGGYYVCDDNVQSEACLPIFAVGTNRLVGIIDAEAAPKQFFTADRLTVLAALALVAPSCLIPG